MERIEYRFLNNKNKNVNKKGEHKKAIDEIITEIGKDNLENDLISVANIVDRLLNNVPSDADIHEFIAVIESLDDFS
ncbi:MAG: hypothetical protein ACK4F9_06280 [Brevinematia bacterium]